MTSIVMSPSNLATFRQCPLRFYGSSISKELPWKGTPQKSRGTVMHTAMERAMRAGWKDDLPFDSQVDAGYVKRTVDEILDRRAHGYDLKIEHEMSMSKAGKAVDWWSVDAWLRAKADVLLLHPDPEKPVIIGDIKTGRVWDTDFFQLRVEALLAHILYQRTGVLLAYWYIDQGETETESIDFSLGLADVQDILDLMQEMKLSIRDNYYPAKPNKFCRFCGFDKTGKCDAR